MKLFYKWYAVVILFVLSWSLADKGIELWELGTDVDGAGIGVYFLIFEINDRVAEMNIPMYAIGFFIASVIAVIAALWLAFKASLSNTRKKNKLKS